MSRSTLKHLLAGLLGRFLKFLAFTRRLLAYRLINYLFAFFASIRRWTRTNPRDVTLHLRRGPPISTNTPESGVVCAMTVPSPGPGPLDTHGHGQLPSPVDLPYINTRSPSGDHLIPPSPARRHSRGPTSWVAGSQTSLHDEPGDMNGTSQVLVDSVALSSSSTPLQTYPGSHTQNSDILSHQPHHPGSLHQMVTVTQETPPTGSEVKSSPRSVLSHLDANNSDPYRIGTPLSMKSSGVSVSQKSSSSRMSNGRASYREYHGPPARTRTPTPAQDIPISVPYSTPTTAEPNGTIAPPSADDPSRPGQPTTSHPHRFYPMSVSGLIRYEHRKTRRPSKNDYEIEAMMCQYPETPDDVPEGWVGYLHPEGALYFVHIESKTFTEVNICDEVILNDIEYFRTFLLSELKTEIKNRNLSESLKVDEVQLVLEPKADDLGLVCCYYFVNPRTRSLFWLDDWDGYEIFKDCRGSLSLPHKGLGIRAHYWCTMRHWDFYPNFCTVTQGLKDEVIDMILHATCDHLTSNTSSCPLTPKELKKHLHLVERIDPKRAEERKHCAIIIGRIMYIFYHNYFLNYHGEECARLNFHERVHGWRYQPSLFMTIFAPLSFMAPINNVRLLHTIFVDDIANKEKWNMFVSKLNSQLQETSVLATVLLNANVAFLPKETGTGVSPFLSYTSLVASIASIILGLAFMGHNRTEARNTPFKAATFLHGSWSDKYGLEKLAIVYSLPHAFLMWGMCLFFAAFVTQWLYASNTELQGGAVAPIVVAATLVAWCIWTARDRSELWWFQSDPNQVEQTEDDDQRKTKHRQAWTSSSSLADVKNQGPSSPESLVMHALDHDPPSSSGADYLRNSHAAA